MGFWAESFEARKNSGKADFVWQRWILRKPALTNFVCERRALLPNEELEVFNIEISFENNK